MNARSVRARSFGEKAWACLCVLGGRGLFLTGFGLALVAALAVAEVRRLAPSDWLTTTSVFGFGGLLGLCGLWVLRERWLSLAPLEGLRGRSYRRQPWLQIVLAAGLFALSGTLIVGSLAHPLPEWKVRWVTRAVGVGCLVGALLALRGVLGRPRHVLVREGLALRHRLGWTLLAWEDLSSCAMVNFHGNPVLSVLLKGPQEVPLHTAWKEGVTSERQVCWLDKMRRAFQQGRDWQGADLMIWGWGCGMPPGLFLLQIEEAFTEQALREQLPRFDDLVKRETR